MDWLGCSPAQGQRMWQAILPDAVAVQVAGKKRWMLAEDVAALADLPGPEPGRLLLLGAHDPYLDQRDRALLLPDRRLQRQVWRQVGNPGVLLRQGKIAGIWKSKTLRGKVAAEPYLLAGALRRRPGRRPATGGSLCGLPADGAGQLHHHRAELTTTGGQSFGLSAGCFGTIIAAVPAGRRGRGRAIPAAAAPPPAWRPAPLCRQSSATARSGPAARAPGSAGPGRSAPWTPR